YEGAWAGSLTCDFVQGELMGPQVMFYERIDYFFWALSRESDWLPDHVRKLLTDGFVEWEAWMPSEPHGFLETLLDAREDGLAASQIDGLDAWVLELATNSAATLELEEEPKELADRLIATGAIDRWLARRSMPAQSDPLS